MRRIKINLKYDFVHPEKYTLFIDGWFHGWFQNEHNKVSPVIGIVEDIYGAVHQVYPWGIQFKSFPEVKDGKSD